MKASTKRKLRIRLLLVLAALIISYVCYGLFSDKFQILDSQITDQLFVLRSKLKPTHQHNDSVIHVDANFYFSRSQHAQVIRNLASMNVSAQLVDFIFAEMVSKEEDQPLINATKEAGNVYYGLTFESLKKQFEKQKNSAREDPEYIKWQVAAKGGDDSFYPGINPQFTYHALSSAARGLGFLNLIPDPDGILRRVPLLVRYRGVLYPSLPFRAVCDYLGVAPENIIIKPGKSITLKDTRLDPGPRPHDIVIPIDKSANMILNDTEFWDDIRHYSYSEIFQASQNSEKLQNLKKELSAKIVVLSEIVEKQYKIRPADDEKFLPSGAIHSLVIHNILSGSFLRKLSGSTAVIIEMGILAIILLMSMRFSSPVLSLGTFTLAGAYMGLAVIFFFYFGVIFQFTRPLLIMLCALGFLLIGLGIEKAILFAKTERARKIAERELEIGREIQSGFFPIALPQPEGWELATYFQAARHVAGDFYDAFTLGKEKKVGVVIADVCDKGVGAALFMALFRSFIRLLSGAAYSDGHLEISNPDTKPEKILQHTIRSINNYISITHEQAGMFATIFYGILDPQTGSLSYINGGHEPPVIIGPQGIKTSLNPTGPAVGLYPNLEFKIRTITLEPGDTLLVYTDGVTDARNKAAEAFTKKRLMKLLADSFPTAEDMINNIKTQINDHISDENQFDDITIMALRRSG